MTLVRLRELRPDVVVAGFSQPQLVPVAAAVSVFAGRVLFDACDSWSLQARERIRAAPASALVPIVGAMFQAIVGPTFTTSYISSRDRAADRYLTGERSSIIVAPRLPPPPAAPPNWPLERPSGVAVFADFTSFHNMRGLQYLTQACSALAERGRPIEVHLFGTGLEAVTPQPGWRLRGWCPDLAGEIESRRLAVFVTNIGGSGTPGKLAEVMRLGAPTLLHSSLRRVGADRYCPIRYFDQPDDLASALAVSVLATAVV